MGTIHDFIVRRVLGHDPNEAAIYAGIVTIPILLFVNEIFNMPQTLGNNAFLIALIVSWVAYFIVYRHQSPTLRVKEDHLKETTNHKPEPKAPEKNENSEKSELKRPEGTGPGASSAEIWHWMEELDTNNLIQAIKAAPRHPPKPPYVPKDEQPAPPKTAPENSEDRLRVMIKLGVQMAEQDTRGLPTQRRSADLLRLWPSG